jgi:hypothetical protein
METPLHPCADKIKITKLTAARAQLRTAITLWFDDGDPISIHTLAFAAYTVIHDASKGKRRDLLFDSRIVKEQYRREWNGRLKQHANFFKHADKDADAKIEFNPVLSEYFILFAIVGITLSGERHSTEESAFLLWVHLHRPELLSTQGQKRFNHDIPIDQIEPVRAVAKNKFLGGFRYALRLGAEPWEWNFI